MKDSLKLSLQRHLFRDNDGGGVYSSNDSDDDDDDDDGKNRYHLTYVTDVKLVLHSQGICHFLPLSYHYHLDL